MKIYLYLILVACLLILSSCIFVSAEQKSDHNANSRPDETSRDIYVLGHPSLSPRIQNLIRNGLVDTDMTKEEVRASWGEPDRITNLSSNQQYDEMWLYVYNILINTRVYFKNNFVVKVDP